MFNACVSFVQDRPEANKGASVFSVSKKFGFKKSNDVAYLLSFLDIFFQGNIRNIRLYLIRVSCSYHIVTTSNFRL